MSHDSSEDQSSEGQASWASSWLIERREDVCARFEAALRLWHEGEGDRPRAEDFLDDIPENHRWEFLHCLLLLEEDYRQRSGEEETSCADFRGRFPEYSSHIAMAFRGPHRDDTAAREQKNGKGSPKRVREYELQEKLGQGGMGVVWKAWHVRLRKHRAIKVLHSHMLESEQAPRAVSKRD